MRRLREWLRGRAEYAAAPYSRRALYRIQSETYGKGYADGQKALGVVEGGGFVPASFLNGPLQGLETVLPYAPLRISHLDVVYEAIMDPDTGRFLGAYSVPFDGEFRA